MAVKSEISFKVFEGGKRTYAVKRVTMVNSWQDVILKAQAFIRQEYPEIDQANIILNEMREDVGIGIIIAVKLPLIFKLEANVL